MKLAKSLNTYKEFDICWFKITLPCCTGMEPEHITAFANLHTSAMLPLVTCDLGASGK